MRKPPPNQWVSESHERYERQSMDLGVLWSREKGFVVYHCLPFRFVRERKGEIMKEKEKPLDHKHEHMLFHE